MPKDSFPQPPTPQLAEIRKKLSPDIHDAFAAFSESVFRDGALPAKTKQLIAVAAATSPNARTAPWSYKSGAAVRGHG